MKRNGNISMKEIRSVAKRIAEKFPIQKIILFGSHAYGVPRENSDVDLLIIMETEERYSEVRYQIYTLLKDFLAPIDVIIRSPQHLKTAHHRRDWFLETIVKRGRLVYGK